MHSWLVRCLDSPKNYRVLLSHWWIENNKYLWEREKFSEFAGVRYIKKLQNWPWVSDYGITPVLLYQQIDEWVVKTLGRGTVKDGCTNDKAAGGYWRMTGSNGGVSSRTTTCISIRPLRYSDILMLVHVTFSINCSFIISHPGHFALISYYKTRTSIWL